ncbi:MAG: hypothetical protein KAW92_01020 [Candidatus Cloacimonetes bacterium]|nr:hypothetical protein [Candidatus Cloacimonadota bacterium]
MNKTELKWVAHFKNQHVLEQFDDKGREHLFKEVLDRQKELYKFELIGSGKIYQVDLRTGKFFIKGVEFFPITESDFQKPLRDVEYRLIYYKRKQTTVTQTTVKKPVLLYYLLGWQALVDGKNFQRIMFIYPDGKVELKSKR